MTPVWARRLVSAASGETENAWGVILGSCRVFMGNRGHLAGTARCGPARRVVWDPWLAEYPSVSHGDPIRQCLQNMYTYAGFFGSRFPPVPPFIPIALMK